MSQLFIALYDYMSNSYIEDILEGEVFAGKSAMLLEVLVGPEVLQRLEQCEQLHKDRLVQVMLRVAMWIIEIVEAVIQIPWSWNSCKHNRRKKMKSAKMEEFQKELQLQKSSANLEVVLLFSRGAGNATFALEKQLELTADSRS